MNEALFRAANERMADWEERHSEEDAELYHCECADMDCLEKISLSKAEYEHVRDDSTHFLVAQGHEDPEIETVIETHDGWALIEKNPDVQALVEQTDPRRS